VLSLWHCKNYFSHPTVVIYFFFNPTHKTKMRTANRSETTNSKPPRRIIMIVPIRNSKEQQLDHIYYSSSPGLVRFAVAFMSLSSELYKLRQDWCQTPVQVTTRLVSNPFAEPNRYVLTFLRPILICRSTQPQSMLWETWVQVTLKNSLMSKLECGKSAKNLQATLRRINK
jgi:hypothetical protein